MSNGEIVNVIKDFQESIKAVQRQITALKSDQITNKNQKDELNQLASFWFESLSKKLLPYGIDKDIIAKYDDAFKSILKLSVNNSRRLSYLKQLQIISKFFTDEILIFMQTDATEPCDLVENDFSAEVVKLLEKVPDKEENEYLKEALGCWTSNYLKAAVILVWCAAIDRIHKVIEKKGFSIFNNTSAAMKAQTTGRFKRYNKDYCVQSISELRMVFDSDILWVLEGMKMIDTNEKTRLTSCFDMRCHSGHPGDAPITKYNVLSCFSDIIEIVLTNPKFSIAKFTQTVDIHE